MVHCLLIFPKNYTNCIILGAVKKLLKWQCELTGAVLQEETVTFPVTGNQQVLLFLVFFILLSHICFFLKYILFSILMIICRKKGKIRKEIMIDFYQFLMFVEPIELNTIYR